MAKTTTVQLGVEQRETLRRVANEMAETNRVAGLSALMTPPTATQLLNGAVELLAGVWDGHLTPVRQEDLVKAITAFCPAFAEDGGADELASNLLKHISSNAGR